MKRINFFSYSFFQLPVFGLVLKIHSASGVLAKSCSIANRQLPRTWCSSFPATAAGICVEKDMAYTLALADSLNRQFCPRQAYLIAPAVLREQRVAWPLQVVRTEPLYDFC